jgi:hypothetical protein
VESTAQFTEKAVLDKSELACENWDFLFWPGNLIDGQWIGAESEARNPIFGHAATMPCG